MNIKRGIAVLAFLGVCALAAAVPDFDTSVQKNYKLKKECKVVKASCALCHVGQETGLNPYGKDLRDAMKKLKSAEISAAVLKSVEQLDSDKDGAKNVDEIKADTLPGDPKSFPPPAPKKPEDAPKPSGQ